MWRLLCLSLSSTSHSFSCPRHRRAAAAHRQLIGKETAATSEKVATLWTQESRSEKMTKKCADGDVLVHEIKYCTQHASASLGSSGPLLLADMWWPSSTTSRQTSLRKLWFHGASMVERVSAIHIGEVLRVVSHGLCGVSVPRNAINEMSRKMFDMRADFLRVWCQ